MAKVEKEVKVLDIDVDMVHNALLGIGARYDGERRQKIYTYDVPTLYYRYLEVLKLFENGDLYSSCLIKLKTLLFEVLDLALDDDLVNIYKRFDLGDKKIVSINTSQLYMEKGIDIQKMAELKFD